MVHRRNLFSIIIIVFFAIVLVSFIALFFISMPRYSEIKAEMASKYDKINEYVKESKMPISQKSIQLLTDERNKLKGIYARFKLVLASPLHEEISDEDLDPLQFKERLIQTQKKLREDADNYNLLLPQSLGFTKYETELSKSSEIPLLIKRLKVLEELIYTMALADVELLEEINFPERDVKKADTGAKAKKSKKKGKKTTRRPPLPVDTEEKQMAVKDKSVGESTKGKEDADVYFDIPASCKIHCTSSKLMDFLYKLSVSPFVFIVEDLDIKKTKEAQSEDKTVERKLKVSLSIKAVALQ